MSPMPRTVTVALATASGRRERSMWTVPGHEERPYDETKVLGARIRQ